ncbi:MAG: permease [Spirochaetes bacterium]|nr:permease [Spirochaetota bacterium]
MNKKNIIKIIIFAVYVIFVNVSFIIGYEPGKQIGFNLKFFSLDMIKIIPFAFILIGLFEVWVKKETIEKHLGEDSSFMGYIWMILLAGTTVGGLYVAFPIAYSLFNKGAKLSIIFTYIGAAAIARIPMVIFEASFIGIKFTVIRLLVSLPLVIISAKLLGDYLTKRGYKIKKGK